MLYTHILQRQRQTFAFFEHQTLVHFINIVFFLNDVT